MRICIVAEHASTRFGGEAILPVHYFRLLRSRGVECWMVVHARTQSEVMEMFPNEIDRILFVPDRWIQKLLFYLSRFLPRRLSEATLGLLNQLITQFCQRAIVRGLIRDRRIDVIHQPIPVAPRFPSVLFGLGAPVVIGPLNGGMDYPPAFRRSESRQSGRVSGEWNRRWHLAKRAGYLRERGSALCLYWTPNGLEGCGCCDPGARKCSLR